MVKAEGKLSITRQCQLLKLPRSSYYYEARAISADDLSLMKAMDRCHLQYSFYGSRRIRRWLADEGFVVSRKKVQRLMGLMGIEARYPKRRLSQPDRSHTIYPYLLKGLRIDRPNQMWCADITYIPMANGFVYLVAIMDWASRRVLSWRLSNTMDASFCVEALEEAIERYGTPEIFNTDQGSQLTSQEFTQALKDHEIRISMDGKGRWIDNVFIERLWRSVKYEEVYLRAYDNMRHARLRLKAYFQFYNTNRRHQALDEYTPDEVYFQTAGRIAA